MAPIIDIIDDDDAVRGSTHELLESYGYKAREHPSAEAFLGHAGAKAACLLVDHHMPGMTGLDLLEHLRAQGDRTPALMVTGKDDPSMEARIARLGARLLKKPLDPDELVDWIERVRLAGA